MNSSNNINDSTASCIALVGCGAVAELFYLPALVRNSSIAHRLILVDIDSERAEAMASRFGVDSYVQDYRDVLSDVDGAIVALPHHLHYEVAMNFLRAGVHVLCEKPLAETAEQAKSMVQEAERQRVSLCVNNTRRLFPSFKKVKDLLRKGTIGEPISFHLEEGGEFNWPTVSGFYFGAKGAKHGVLMDRGPHVIDLLCWWFESRPVITSCMDDSFGGCEAVATLDLKVNDSCSGTIKLSWLSRLENKYTIRGETGILICEPFGWRQIELIKNGSSTKIHPPTPQKQFSDFGFEMVDNFLAVIHDQKPPLVSGGDVIDSITVIEEYYSLRRTYALPWLKAGKPQ